MAAARSELLLDITGSSGAQTVQLRVGESYIIGRSGRSQYIIERKSISQEHLEIVWDGREVLVRDLASSNGTFRMPQDSPFLEARFPPQYQGLELRLASTEIVCLGWTPSSERTLAKTAVIGQTKFEVGSTRDNAPRTAAPSQGFKELSSTETVGIDDTSPKTQVSSQVVSPAEAKSATAAGATASRADPPQTRQAPTETSPHRRFRAMGAPGLRGWDGKTALLHVAWIGGALLAALYVWRARFGSFWEASSAEMSAGGAKDFAILWVSFTIQQAPIVFAVIALALAVFWGLDNFFKLGPHRQGARILARASLGALAWALPMVAVGGLPILSFLPDAVAFHRRILAAVPVAEAEGAQLRDQVDWLRARSEIYAGSGLAYKAAFDRQWTRVVRECDGVGEDRKWARKRVCLVLLSSVAIENLRDFKPALLRSTAERAALLTALDGLTRVLQMEGRQSEFAKLFLNSLRSAGLEGERADLEKLLQDSSKSAETLRQVLFELRRHVDRALVELQRERRLPVALRLRVPGPLESGI